MDKQLNKMRNERGEIAEEIRHDLARIIAGKSRGANRADILEAVGDYFEYIHRDNFSRFIVDENGRPWYVAGQHEPAELAAIRASILKEYRKGRENIKRLKREKKAI